jgi:hypothetical protein
MPSVGTILVVALLVVIVAWALRDLRKKNPCGEINPACRGCPLAAHCSSNTRAVKQDLLEKSQT